MKSIAQHTVPKAYTGVILKKYLSTAFPMLPSSNQGIKKVIAQKRILLDGEIAQWDTPLQEGQIITLLEDASATPKVFQLSLEIIYEDEHMAIVYKPAGIPVSGNQFKTIVNALPYSLTPSKETDALRTFRPVHRLDAPTTGLLMVAKNSRAMIALGQQLEEKKIQKIYQAVVIGTPPAEGELHTPMEEKNAHSRFETLRTVPSIRNGSLSLVKLWPYTGRTHQLRIHMASIGHPIVGDKQYGASPNMLTHKGLFLSAVALELPHPITGELMNISVEAPAKFNSLLEREQRRIL
ncbi:RluA family pseudouridine synthase [Algivirga pacifica]|uniref:Pseudouridine synthase n=1 Tax=Algivirga pacifica TaxID=1162670 RepID=A0ABP9D024_9BACT